MLRGDDTEPLAHSTLCPHACTIGAHLVSCHQSDEQ